MNANIYHNHQAPRSCKTVPPTLLSLTLALLLASCSIYSNEFDCPTGKSAGCVSVSHVNDLVNENDDSSGYDLDSFDEHKYSNHIQHAPTNSKGSAHPPRRSFRVSGSNLAITDSDVASDALLFDKEAQVRKNMTDQVEKSEEEGVMQASANGERQRKADKSNNQTSQARPGKAKKENKKKKEKVTVWFYEHQDGKDLREWREANVFIKNNK